MTAWKFGPPEQPGVLTQWEIASGHPGGWRVTRYLNGYGHTLQQHSSKVGNVILYKTPEAARRKAEELNNLQTVVSTGANPFAR
jgi:hypothetical protein